LHFLVVAAAEDEQDSGKQGESFSYHGAQYTIARLMRRGAAFLAGVAAACAAAHAHASTPDVFGLGSRSTALAGAVTAQADDFSACYYNPAGLALAGDEYELSIGISAYDSSLSIQGQGVSITDPIGIDVGLRAPLPLGGPLAGRLFFGAALHSLPGQILRVLAHRPGDAFFPYYDNRTQRLVVLPALAARILPQLVVGIGFDFLAGLDGKVEAQTGATRTIEPRLDQHVESTVRLHAGLRWQARPSLALGLAFRQGFAVPFRIDTSNQIAGQSIDINIDAQGLFTPDELWAGAALRLSEALRVSLDVGWLRWSDWRGPYVAVTSQLPIAGTLDVPPPDLRYQDIVTVRAGLEWQVAGVTAAQVVLRAGAGYEPSPVPDQPGVTNLVDGDKLILAGGAGVVLSRLLPLPVRIDAHLMAHRVSDRTYVKRVFPIGDTSCPLANPVCGLHDEVRDNPSTPASLGTQISNVGYPSLSGGGTVWQAGLTVTVSR
jgi:long-chain fatty acid transport protein